MIDEASLRPETGADLARVRRLSGLTQDEAAAEVGMRSRRRQVTWSEWESLTELTAGARAAGRALALGLR